MCRLVAGGLDRVGVVLPDVCLFLISSWGGVSPENFSTFFPSELIMGVPLLPLFPIEFLVIVHHCKLK